MKLNHLPRYKRALRAWIRKRECRGFTLDESETRLPRQRGKVRHLLSLYSSNTKNGRQLQTWHLSASMHPTEARRNGAGDGPICGDCPFRGPLCYVNGQGLGSLHKSWQRGNYPLFSEAANDIGLNMPQALRVLGTLADGVRLGAYGDPCAMDPAIARALVGFADTRQGFTHAWRDFGGTPWQGLIMASCELPEQVGKAAAAGWRTFTVYPPELSEKQARQAIARASGRQVLAHCPASARKGYSASCDTCPIQCDGVREGSPWHVLNAAHGSPHTLSRFRSAGYLEKWSRYL